MSSFKWAQNHSSRFQKAQENIGQGPERLRAFEEILNRVLDTEPK